MWYINIFKNSKFISSKKYDNAEISLLIEDFDPDCAYDVIDNKVVKIPRSVKPEIIEYNFLQSAIDSI